MVKQTIKAIVFDFDGTLVDSLKIKYEARFELFAEETAAVRAVAAEVIPQIRGKLRGEIIRAVLQRTHGELVGSKAFEERVANYIQRYDRLIENRIVAQGLFPGVREMLESVNVRYALYVNSGTPEYALKKLLERLKSDLFFKAACGIDPSRTEGASVMKQENMQRIIKQASVHPAQVVVVGDGTEDLDCAQASGCSFVAIRSERNEWGGQTEFPIINSAAELPSILD